MTTQPVAVTIADDEDDHLEVDDDDEMQSFNSNHNNHMD